MTRVFQRLACVLLVSALAFTAQAQDSVPSDAPARDPHSLAQRYLGFTGDTPIPPLTPIYSPGDKTQFWVAKSDSPTPVRVSATLAAAAPNVYLWVEDGVSVAGDLPKNAATLGGFLIGLRSHDNYRQSVSVPGIGTFSDSADLLPIPDVDNDDHLFILYTSHLAESSGTIINPLDSQPVEYAPYSNQHEMLYVNTTPHPGTPLDDPNYNNQVILALYRWIIHTNVPTQAAWLTDALDWGLLLQIQQTKIDDASLATYLQITDTPLIQPVSQVSSIGEQQLFLGYLLQRYGSDPFIDLFLQPGKGITPLDDALRQHAISDPVSGAPVTGRDAYADFAMTNGLNLAFGDWRYVESTVPLPNGVLASARTLDPAADYDDSTVSQFGAQYFRYSNSDTTPATVALSFDGSPTVARLPMPADRDPADAYYWSGFGGDHDATLTRAVDLTGVSKATLTFDAWYNLASDWDYGYVAASTDDGVTWKALTASNSTASNTYGVAYGANFTGISNPVKPHPFPTLGVIIASDDITISDVVADGAGAKAGIQKGDQIIGYDQQVWSGKPDVIGLLGNYYPGDTLHLYILRGTERIDLPVVLAPHPTRLYHSAAALAAADRRSDALCRKENSAPF